MERGDPVVVAASTFGLQFRQELCAHARESHHWLSTYQSVSLQPVNPRVSLGGTIIEPRNILQSFKGANNINMLCELYKLTSRYRQFVPDSKLRPSADLKH